MEPYLDSRITNIQAFKLYPPWIEHQLKFKTEVEPSLTIIENPIRYCSINDCRNLQDDNNKCLCRTGFYGEIKTSEEIQMLNERQQNFTKLMKLQNKIRSKNDNIINLWHQERDRIEYQLYQLRRKHIRPSEWIIDDYELELDEKGRFEDDDDLDYYPMGDDYY
jgi:hypothetical protein